MKNIKRNAMAVAGALALLSGGVAHADLLEYSFTGADGSPRTVPADANYVNPEGSITFALSGGVDRRVRITIFDENEEPVSSGVSELLGAEDRISVSGKEYYGAFLVLPAPGEGQYKLKADILTGTGSVIKEDIFDVEIDTTPPVITGSPYLKKHQDGLVKLTRFLVERAHRILLSKA